MSSETSDNLVLCQEKGSLQFGHTLCMKLMHNKQQRGKGLLLQVAVSGKFMYGLYCYKTDTVNFSY